MVGKRELRTRKKGDVFEKKAVKKNEQQMLLRKRRRIFQERQDHEAVKGQISSY